jgi:SAM-dependent methyltransferase
MQERVSFLNSSRRIAKAVLPDAVVVGIRKYLNPSDVQWARIVMNRECDALVDTLRTERLDCLEISGHGSRWQNRRWASYRSTAYPEYDICAEPLDGGWDFMIAEQVLEHVPNPERAVHNAFTMLRPGGILLVTTPFLIKFHPCPADFSRWTADGIKGLLTRAGFDRVTTGSWGNRDCILADLTDDDHWTLYKPRKHSLRNDPRFPVVVWAFAHKSPC